MKITTIVFTLGLFFVGIGCASRGGERGTKVEAKRIPYFVSYIDVWSATKLMPGMPAPSATMTNYGSVHMVMWSAEGPTVAELDALKVAIEGDEAQRERVGLKPNVIILSYHPMKAI